MSRESRQLASRGDKLAAALVVALCFGTSGCMTSHGLLQTAHTTPPKSIQTRSGASLVRNSIDEQAGRGYSTNTTAEAGARLGVTEFLDVGVAPLLGGGAAADAKANVIDNRLSFALAPRLSFGYAWSASARAYVAEAGAITSYRFVERIEPYAALSFANHWVMTDRTSAEPPPGEVFAERRGYGDGLLKATSGLSLRLGAGFSLLGEYAHWFVAQNDPGDGYAFLASNVFAVALEFRSEDSRTATDVPPGYGEVSQLTR